MLWRAVELLEGTDWVDDDVTDDGEVVELPADVEAELEVTGFAVVDMDVAVDALDVAPVLKLLLVLMVELVALLLIILETLLRLLLDTLLLLPIVLLVVPVLATAEELVEGPLTETLVLDKTMLLEGLTAAVELLLLPPPEVLETVMVFKGMLGLDPVTLTLLIELETVAEPDALRTELEKLKALEELTPLWLSVAGLPVELETLVELDPVVGLAGLLTELERMAVFDPVDTLDEMVLIELERLAVLDPIELLPELLLMELETVAVLDPAEGLIGPLVELEMLAVPDPVEMPVELLTEFVSIIVLDPGEALDALLTEFEIGVLPNPGVVIEEPLAGGA